MLQRDTEAGKHAAQSTQSGIKQARETSGRQV